MTAALGIGVGSYRGVVVREALGLDEEVTGIKGLIDRYKFKPGLSGHYEGQLIPLEEDEVLSVIERGGFFVAQAHQGIRCLSPHTYLASVNHSAAGIIGCASVVEYGMNHGSNANIAELRSLAVHPDWEGLGIGTALIGACVQEATARGHRTLYTLTQPDKIPLFEKAGFTVADIPLVKRSQDCGTCVFYNNGCSEVALMRTL